MRKSDDHNMELRMGNTDTANIFFYHILYHYGDILHTSTDSS